MASTTTHGDSATTGHDGLRELAEEWWDGLMARNPHAATGLGDHRFDDAVEDLSPAGLDDQRRFALDVAARATAIADADLDVHDRVTRALLIDSCQEVVEEVDSDQIQIQSDGFTGFPVVLLRGAAQRRAPDEASAGRQLERLGRLAGTLDDVVAQWRAGEARGWLPARAALARSVGMVEGYLATPIDQDPFVALTLPEDWDGAAAWRTEAARVVEAGVRPAYRRVLDTLLALHDAGRDDDRPGLCHVPGGDALYRSLVRRATTTELTPEEIHEIGMRELTDVLPAQWADVGARALGITDRDELFAHLRTDPSLKYGSAEEILEVATEAIARAVDAAPDWFESLPEADCVVQPVPASLAPGLPPAYYSPPPSDGSRPGIYFANTHEPTRRNRFESECIAFHEAVPGHHLERAMAAELVDVPTFQKRGGYMAYSEGWGLYTERLADEMGLYSSETMRLGMLSADAWRSVRLVVDTGMHALGWTRTEALDFMVTHAPLDRDEAAVEIDRYIGMPAQALSYKVGQRELFRLRDDARARLGDRFDIAAFHTTVLGHGGVPLGVLAELVDGWVDGLTGAGTS